MPNPIQLTKSTQAELDNLASNNQPDSGRFGYKGDNNDAIALLVGQGKNKAPAEFPSIEYLSTNTIETTKSVVAHEGFFVGDKKVIDAGGNFLGLSNSSGGGAIKTNATLTAPESAIAGQTVEVVMNAYQNLDGAAIGGVLLLKATLYANEENIGELDFSDYSSLPISNPANTTITLPANLNVGDTYEIKAVLEDEAGNIFAPVFASIAIIENNPPDVSNTTITGTVPGELFIGSTFELTVNNKPTGSQIVVDIDGNNHGISVMQNPNNDVLSFSVAEHVENENVTISVSAEKDGLQSLIRSYNTVMKGSPSGSLNITRSGTYRINGLVDSITITGNGGAGVASSGNEWTDTATTIDTSASPRSVSWSNSPNSVLTSSSINGVAEISGRNTDFSVLYYGFTHKDDGNRNSIAYARQRSPYVPCIAGAATIINGDATHEFAGAANCVTSTPAQQEVVKVLTKKTNGSDHVFNVTIATRGGHLRMEW